MIKIPLKQIQLLLRGFCVFAMVVFIIIRSAHEQFDIWQNIKNKKVWALVVHSPACGRRV
jgi:hypothetical protein